MISWKNILISWCSSLVIFNGGYATLTWTSPSNISLPGYNAISPQVCFTPEQYACAIWSRSNGTNFVIQVSTASLEGNWSSPFRLSKINQNAFFPVIATDRLGNSTALWSRFNGTNFVIQTDNKVSHTEWSDPVTLSGKGPQHGDASKPLLSLHPDGLHIAIWYKNNGINNVIQSCQKNSDGGWDKPVNITSANPKGLGDIDPRLAIDNAGNAYAIWINDSTSTLRGAMKSSGGTWSIPIDISSAGKSLSSPGLALDSLGNVTAIWTQSDGVNYVVQSAAKAVNDPITSVTDLSDSSQSSLQPQLSVDASGNKVAIWHRFDGSNTIVQATIQPSGGVWQTPVNISENGQDASDPQVKIDPQGNIIAVWKRSDGKNFIIQASIGNVKGTEWSTPVTLSNSGEDALIPQLAVSNTGNLVVAWQRSDGKNSIIQGVFGINH